MQRIALSSTRCGLVGNRLVFHGFADSHVLDADPLIGKSVTHFGLPIYHIQSAARERAWTARSIFSEISLSHTHRPATNMPPQAWETLSRRASSGTMRFGPTTHTQMSSFEDSTIRSVAGSKPACGSSRKEV
jgi:hypothetical protein